MTDLTKPVRRRSSTIVQGTRRLVIEIRPGAVDTVIIREEGRRTGYTVPIAAIYRLGARIAADVERADRVKTRKARKEAKR